MPTTTVSKVTEVAQVKSTMDYDQFHFLSNNREPNRGHVEALKKAFEEYGNLTQTQPVLVNERMQIIDGQHRFLACQEIGAPIFYSMVPGLGIQEARKMNILHRGWNTDDYAKSYADGGNLHYQKYLELKEEYGYSHSVMLQFSVSRRDKRGIFAEFREGDFEIQDEEAVRNRLDMLKAVESIVGQSLASDKVFATAFLKLSVVDGFKLDRMLKKLIERRDFMRRFTSQEDAMRQLEEAYNHGMSESNRVRLY